MAQLSTSEIQQYHASGYLVPNFRLATPKITHLQTVLNELIVNNPGVRPEKLVSAHIERTGGRDNGEGVKGSNEFLKLAQDPEIVEMVSQIIGPDVILWGCHIF